MACNSSGARSSLVLAGVALLLVVSLLQQGWPQQGLIHSSGEGSQLGRRMAEEGNTTLTPPTAITTEVHECAEEKKWSSSNQIAVMLFIFIVLNIFFLYFVFSRDPDIRKATFTMLSSTMSIFIAVSMNTAAFSFFLKQVIAGKGWNHLGPISFPRGLGNWISLGARGEFIVSVLLFLCFEGALNCGVFWAKENKNARCAVRVIGGHLMAFAGIITFGSLQLKAEENKAMAYHHYAFVLLSFLISIVFRLIIGQIRNYWFTLPHPLLSMRLLTFEGGEEEGEDLHGEMKEAIAEAENDAFSLIFGFLITQLAVWKATGRLMPLQPVRSQVHTQHQVFEMVAFFAMALVFLGISVPALKELCKVRPFPPDWAASVEECGQLTCLMIASWTALTAANWQMQIWLSGTPLSSPEMAEVFTAFFLTIAAVTGIKVLDMAGDWLKKYRKQTRKKKQEAAEDGAEDAAKKHSKFIEKTLRKIIEALGVLVGLGWEKACHGALDTVIKSIPMLDDHRAYSGFGAAVVLSLYILPAWYWHVLPLANKSVDEHEISINVALIHRLHSECKIKDHLHTHLPDVAERTKSLKKTLKALQEMGKQLENDLKVSNDDIPVDNHLSSVETQL